MCMRTIEIDFSRELGIVVPFSFRLPFPHLNIKTLISTALNQLLSLHRLCSIPFMLPITSIEVVKLLEVNSMLGF